MGFCSISRPARYEDLEQSDVRVQYLWEALTSFTNGQFTVINVLQSMCICPSENINRYYS